MTSRLPAVARIVMSASKRRRNTSSPPSSPSSRAQSPAGAMVLEGCFAVHKPVNMTSADVIRDVKPYLSRSELFAPLIARETAKKALEPEWEQRKRRKVKSNVKEVKMGHGGTLDPNATGVLILGVGGGTKALGSFLGCTKTYETVVLFGTATDSYDAVGKVVEHKSHTHITKGMVEEALEQFKGDFLQRPPIYSALNMDGKRLYDYAREGIAPPREIVRRDVTVDEIDMVEWMEGGTHEYKAPKEEATENVKAFMHKLWDTYRGDTKVVESAKIKTEASDGSAEEVSAAAPPSEDEAGYLGSDESKRGLDNPHAPTMAGALAVGDKTTTDATDQTSTEAVPAAKGPPAARIRITSGSGFYVRSLCYDLGKAVNSVAHMSTLVRTRQADFELDKNVVPLEQFEKGEDVWGPQVEASMAHWNSKREQ